MPDDLNQEISRFELGLIRTLDDFDLKMLISEIHDHGWPVAQKTLGLIWEAKKTVLSDRLDAND